MAYGIVYLIIDGTNDLEYVGQTTKTAEERFNEHAKNKNSYIGRSIRAHGEDKFVIAILKVCYSKEDLDFWEKHFIKSRNTIYPNGYKFTEGGEGGKPCDEVRAKISESKSGAKHPFFGKHHTPEHCANISAGLRGVPKSPEHCAKLSKVRIGKLPKDETRDNMSESRLGEKNPNFGKPRPSETCAKISAKNRCESTYKNLVAELEARQLSYVAFAKLLDLNPSTISEKMRGRKNFTDEQRAKIEEFFGKPAEYLFQRDENFCFKPVTDCRKSPYKNLIAELDARQLSYPAIAEIIGSTKQSFCKKIRGERSFKDSDKKKLAEIFGKPIEYLLQRDD